MNNQVKIIQFKKYIPAYGIRDIVKIGLLSAIAFVLMLLSFPIAVIFPSFLKMDLSDLPALLGAFTLGPIAGVFIELIKNLLNILIKGTDTGGIGELSNFIVGSSFVIPASIIYIKWKNKKGATAGMVAGIVVMTIVACFSNYYLIIPLYQTFIPLDTIIGMAAMANKAIVDIPTYILYAVVPFNIFKSVLLSLVTLLIYKKVSPLLHK